MFAALDGYAVFLLKYSVLQAIRLATSTSPLWALFVLGDQLDVSNLTPLQMVVLVVIIVLNVFGRLTPLRLVS